MKKVLFTASTFSHIKNFHLPYLHNFRSSGWCVHVACGGIELHTDVADELIRLPLKKNMLSPHNFLAASILRKQIIKEKYDLICTHTSLAAFFTRLALFGLKWRPKVINMVHGYLFDDNTNILKQRLLMLAEKITANKTDLILTMNQWDYKAAIKNRWAKRVEMIPGVGVNHSEFCKGADIDKYALRKEHGIPENSFVLIYAAEFSKRKNQQTLIRAMSALPEEVILILLGEGAQRDYCIKLTAELGLEHRIIFPGHVSDVAAWYSVSDVIVSSSRSEGLPFNIMEAMGLGKAIILSSVKGHTDLLEDNISGMFFPYGDSSAFAECVIKLLKSQELRDSLGKQANALAQNYDINTVFDKVMNNYLSVF